MPILGEQGQDAKFQELCCSFGLEPSNIPQHVAIVMDGNGRWAAKKGLPRVMGHKQGAESLREVIRACADFHVHYLSVYAFSSENWTRPAEEVGFLMKFFRELIAREIPKLHKEGVRVRILGDVEGLDKDLRDLVRYAHETTENNTVMQFNILLNYGSRAEMTLAVKRLSNDIVAGVIAAESVTEDVFASYLYTVDIPDPDIVIRPGGEHRLSNFLLWQSAYSEVFFLDTLWPDFDRVALVQVVAQFQTRKRRFGGV
ncbi:MAG: isoprenyl transferase [Candidatus Margulisbacteria bacterium]|nr:isoprenyl transferase [Candidatus Margulisiibacteriota bacterium]